MDPDQDLLDQLEAKETRHTPSAAWVIAAISFFAGIVAYFSLRLEIHASREVSLDGGVLVAIGVCAALFVAHRKIK